LPIPSDLSGKINAGEEVEVIEAMGRRILSRALS